MSNLLIKNAERYLSPYVSEDLQSKMVFIGGPRQVGKTTLSLRYLDPPYEKHPAYFNWDSREDRSSLIEEKLPIGEPLIILDEVHKYKHWRNLIKGFYDKHKGVHKFLVTGSARLDYYRRGGDSLQGRYHYYRLHPLSLGELNKIFASKHSLEQLMEFGGFPEPYFSADKRKWRRWQRERITRVLNEDLLNLEQVQELSQMTLLADALPSKVGSPLSIQSVAEDLAVAHATAKRWLQILENLYVCFRISPFGAPKIRAVKKEQKLYLWDWSLCESEGSKFENLVASQLLKFCHFKEDTEGYNMELRYIRDIHQREVDFVVLQDKKPLFAVECKVKGKNIDSSIPYFKERTKISEFYQVHLGDESYKKNGIKVLPFTEFVSVLNLP